MTCATNKTIEYGSPWSFDTPTATSDNCSNPVVSVMGTVTNAVASSNQVLSVTRSWNAVDNCGNQASCSQAITVVEHRTARADLCQQQNDRCGTLGISIAPPRSTRSTAPTF